MEGIFYILTLLPLYLKCVPIVFVFLCKFQRYDASKPVWKTPSKSEMLLIINLKKTRRIKMFRWVRCCIFPATEKNKNSMTTKNTHKKKTPHHLKRSADNASTLWCEAISERVGGSSLKEAFQRVKPSCMEMLHMQGKLRIWYCCRFSSISYTG